MDARSLDRLRRGRMPVEATLDLHGLSAAQAQPRLRQFLRGCYARQARCVLVITGKGRHRGQDEFDRPSGGVLRRSLDLWLNEPDLAPIVLRCVTAQPKHGGSGAFYILLRRAR